MNTTAKETSLAGTWMLDPVHSNLDFVITHLVISKVKGSFESYNATIKNEGENFEDSHISFSIDVNSINTRNKDRDNHLKSDDFFNAEMFPKITFESTAIEQTDEDDYIIKGNLTIRDITKEVAFQTHIGGIAVDGYGNTKLGLNVRASINRFDYNLKWNQLTEAGGATVGKNVDIIGDLQFGLNK